MESIDPTLIFPISLSDDKNKIYCIILKDKYELKKILNYLIEQYFANIKTSPVYRYYLFLNSLITINPEKISYEIPKHSIDTYIIENIASNISETIEITKNLIEDVFFQKRFFKTFFKN